MKQEEEILSNEELMKGVNTNFLAAKVILWTLYITSIILIGIELIVSQSKWYLLLILMIDLVPIIICYFINGQSDLQLLRLRYAKQEIIEEINKCQKKNQ